MGRWGRGQENPMKLFSGRVSAGLEFPSAFVIYSVGGRGGDRPRCSNILSQAKTNPRVRESDLGWIRLPSLTPNGNGTQV